MLEVIYFDTK